VVSKKSMISLECKPISQAASKEKRKANNKDI
jgi:hypothetical protein